MKWKDIKKFDAHVHVLPPERIDELLLEESGTDFQKAGIACLLESMDENNIEKALLVPNNNSRMYYDMRRTNEFLSQAIQKAPERLFAFSDFTMKDSNDLHEVPEELQYAVNKLGLCGLKIHPANLNVPIDDLRFVPILRKAAELQIPVMVHSYPWGPGFYDVCAPDRINRMIKTFPDIKFITAHMGGMRYLDAVRCVGMVDISCTLLDLVDMYDIKGANRILRKFGANRLMFASDSPFFEYSQYFDILDKMDFTEDEKERIAYKNISALLFSESAL